MSKFYRLSWREMGDFRRDQLGTCLKLTERLGRVARVNLFGVELAIVSDPDVIRELLIKHSRQLHRDPFTRRVLGRILGNGVFTAEDDAWKRQRKLVQPVFHAGHIDDFADTFAHYTHQMCDSWQTRETIQLDQEMMQLTLRIIAKTMFGADIDTAMDELRGNLQTIVTEAEAQLKLGLPLPNWLPTPGNLRQKRALGNIHKMLLQIIHKRQAQIQRGEEPPKDLLSMLVLARDEEDQPMSDVEILDECMTIFFAGHETTATALTWTWVLLLQHPDVLAQLYTEVDTAVSDTPITYQALARMPYVTQVIKEAMRLYPPAPGFARAPTEPFSVNGENFKPGDTIMISTYTLHRDAEFYPEPTAFRPERFAPDSPQPSRYAYIPFGAGSRICIGNAFAMLEMQIVLATMVQSMRLSMSPEPEVIAETLVTLRPRDGVRVCVEEKRELLAVPAV